MTATDLTVKASSRRYLVMLTFFFLTITNAYQYGQYSSISYKMGYLYGESQASIEVFATVFFILYIPLMLPSSMLLNRIGLRWAMLLSSLLNAIGAVMKLLTSSTSGFLLTIVSQIFAAFAQMYVLGMPTEIAAIWFTSNEVSTATSIGVVADQLGIALSLIVPTWIVTQSLPDDYLASITGNADSNNDNVTTVNMTQSEIQSNIGSQLFVNNAIVAVIAVIAFVSSIIFVRDYPVHPPSVAQQLARGQRLETQLRTVRQELSATYKEFRRLICNKPYMLIFACFAINTGFVYSFAVLLNPIAQVYYQGENKSIGGMGLAFAGVGLIGALAAGPIMDKTRQYKLITITTNILVLISITTFSVSMPSLPVIPTIAACSMLGLFTTGYMPVCFEFAAEVTYPASEFLISGLMNIGADIVGLTLTYTCQALISRGFVSIACALMIGIMSVGFVLSCFIPEKLSRQKAEHNKEEHNIKNQTSVVLNF